MWRDLNLWRVNFVCVVILIVSTVKTRHCIYYKHQFINAFFAQEYKCRYPENHTKPVNHVCKITAKSLVLKWLVFIVTTVLETVSPASYKCCILGSQVVMRAQTLVPWGQSFYRQLHWLWIKLILQHIFCCFIFIGFSAARFFSSSSYSLLSFIY